MAHGFPPCSPEWIALLASCIRVMVLALAVAGAGFVAAPTAQADCEPLAGSCPPPDPEGGGGPELCVEQGRPVPCPPPPP